MVLTKEELIASLQNEVRIFVHLAGKVDKSMLDYRPTPKQRSTLELVQYTAIMAPAQIVSIKSGDFSREAMMATWGAAEAAAKAMSFEQAVAAIQKQSSDLTNMLDLFGQKNSRGYLVVNLVLSGLAAYRMQLFCYLKSSGREELNTFNLWMGKDGSMSAA